MFLKNIPPVVAQHTQCKAFSSSSGAHSLCPCLSDSDSESSTSVPEKVQRIIDSLRSSQSSVDMSSACSNPAAAGPNGLTARRTAEPEPRADSESSDDSVDREIEAAIKELLKTKFAKKQNSSKNCAKITKKARRKNLNVDFHPNDGAEGVCKAHQLGKQNTKSKDSQTLCYSLQVKQESDSSSDDGIEEEIQKFLQEKENEKYKDTQTSCKPFKLNQEFVYSEDGAKESVQLYKLEEGETDEKNKIKNAKLSEAQYNQEKTEENKKEISMEKRRSRKKKVKNLQPVLLTSIVTCHCPSRLLVSNKNDNDVSLTEKRPSLGFVNGNTAGELKCEETTSDVPTAVVLASVDYGLAFTNSSLPPPPTLSTDFINSSGSNTCSVDINGSTKQKISDSTKMPSQIWNQLSEGMNFKSASNPDLDQKRHVDVHQTKTMRLSLSRKRRIKEAINLKQPSQVKGVKECNRNDTRLSSKRSADKGDGLENPELGIDPQIEVDNGEKSNSMDNDGNLGEKIKNKKYIQKNNKKVKKRPRDSKFKSMDTVSSEALLSYQLDMSQLEKATAADCKTENIKIINNCTSDRIKGTTKKNDSAGKHSKHRTKKAKVQTKAIKPSCSRSQMEAGNPLDGDDSTEQEKQTLLRKTCIVSKLISKAEDSKTISSTNNTDSVAEMEFNTLSQQAEFQTAIVAPCLNLSLGEAHVNKEVLQSMPIGQQQCHEFSTNKEPCLKEVSSVDSLKNDPLNDTDRSKSIVNLEETPLATSTKRKGRSAKRVIANSFETKASPVPKSDNQNLLHKSPFGFSNVGESGTEKYNDLPQFHLTNCIDNKSLSLDNLTNIYYCSQKTPIDNAPASSLTSSSEVDGCVLHNQVIQGVQCQVSCSVPWEKVGVEEGETGLMKSPHRSSSGLLVRDTAPNSASYSRDSNRKSEEANIKAEEQITTEVTEYVDETDCESDEGRNAGQSSRERRRHRHKSLSTSIDPGVKFRPYIILNMPQRHQKYIKFKKLAFIADQQSCGPRVNQKPIKENCRISTSMSVDVKTFYTKTIHHHEPLLPKVAFSG